MKIYTKKGDKGKTSLLSGTKVLKSNPRIEAYGTVDELNSFIGMLRSSASRLNQDNVLELIQNQLFNIGSQLAMDKANTAIKLPEININDIERIENEIDEMDASLPELKSFIIPGGSMPVAMAHVCRSVCRRAERLCVKLSEKEKVNELIIIYLNRLSDFFFVLARKIALDNNIDLPVWKSYK
ncbi:MAG: cob(I)yrinic acid a,c-diamide adenosyltransferase [Bacteroidales bacterium]